MSAIVSYLPIIFPLIFLAFVFSFYMMNRRKETSDKIASRIRSAQELGIQHASAENVRLFQSEAEKILEVQLDDFFKDLGKKRGVSTGKFQKLLGGVSTGGALALVSICWLAAFGLLKLFLSVSMTLSIVLGFPLGLFFAFSLLKKYQAKRENEFMETFPLAFDIVSRGLKAGGTIERTFQTAAEELEGPVSQEFKIINEQIEFGVPFEEAMINAAERIQIDEFSFFAIALIIQREAGGSLADLVGSISTFIRKRRELKLKVNALTAEGKATGMIVGLLPLAILGVMYFINPDHIDTFRFDPAGRKLGYFLAGYMFVGYMVVQKMTKMKV